MSDIGDSASAFEAPTAPPGATSGPPPISPPIAPGPLAYSQRPTVWPDVLGWILIVFGGLGILGGVWGIVSSNMFRFFERFSPPGAPNPMSALSKWSVSLALLNGIASLIAGLLLAGGIGLLRRRPWSRPAIVWWAWLKAVFAVGMTAVTACMQYDMMQSMAAEMSKQSATSGRPGPPPGFFTGFGIAMAVVGGLFGFLWYAALPIFALIWFNLKSVRAEMASWQEGPTRG